MKPFFDNGQFKQLQSPSTSAPNFLPVKNGYGVEIRNGRDLNKRGNALFISSGRWAEMPNDGIIDQEVPPCVFGQSIDILNISSFTEQTERKTAAQVLESGEIITSDTIDFDPQTSKDGRITVFEMRSRGYVSQEEIPYKIRGIKVETATILGYSVGKHVNPFLDGGQDDLGVVKTGYYGLERDVENLFFYDYTVQNALGFTILSGDYSAAIQRGAHGSILYSSEFGTDSIAFAGLKK